MNNNRLYSATALTAIATVLAGHIIFPGSAAAQDAAEQQGLDAARAGSEEITITARKRTESLQKVPVAASVVGSKVLEDYQINEIADVVGRIPALNVQVGGSGAGGQISLRGIGTTNISAAFDSAVAFNFDGVQISTMRILQAAFFDIEQIDILKGPQSLFFGKSASAGVLSVRSANPTEEWEFGVKTSYEFEEKGYTVGGFASGPITDTLGIRIAAQYQDIDEFVKLEPGTPSAYGDAKGLRNLIGRVTLQWDPTSKFSANLKLNYNHYDSDTLLGHSDIDCGVNGIADPVFLLGGGIQIASNASCNIDDGRYPSGDAHPSIRVILPGTTGADRFNAANGTSYNETKTFFGRLSWDWELTDTLTLSSVTGYINLENEHLDTFGYVGILPDGRPGGLPAPFSDALEQTTQELRLTSDFDGPFNFMVGGFWEQRDIPLTTSQNAVVISLVAPDPITGSTFDWYSERITTTEAYSVFASGSFDITDKLQLAGGVRWSNEDKDATVAFPYVHAFIGTGATFLRSGFFAGPIKFSDSNLSPEVTLSYQLTDDINFYAAYKTGFKSGGIDNSALPTNSLNGLNSDDPVIRAAAEDALTYDSETSEGGEIGMKARFADRTLTVNTVLYYYVFSDLQVQNFDAQKIQFFTENASELTTKGAEVEWSWLTPLEGLSMSGSVAYTDTKYTKSFVPFTDDLNGRTGARAPKWSGNVAFDWSTPIQDTLELSVNGNMAFSSSYFTSASYLDDYENPSYVTFDGSISIGDPDGLWKLSLIGVNLGDELWVNTRGGRPFLSPTGDDRVVTQNRGRQIFVEASFNF